MYDEQQENVDDLKRFIEQRYAGQDYDEYDEAETTEVEQQALLPSVKDPKLWMLKCKVMFFLIQRRFDKNLVYFCCFEIMVVAYGVLVSTFHSLYRLWSLAFLIEYRLVIGWSRT